MHLLLACCGLLVILVALAAAWVAVDRVTAERAGDADGAVRTVDLQFQTVDGDSGRPVAGVGVRCVIEGLRGVVTRETRSDVGGMVIVRGVDTGAALSFHLRPPRGYEAFDVEWTVAQAATAALGARAGAGAGVDGVDAPASASASPGAGEAPAAATGDSSAAASSRPAAAVAPLLLYRTAGQWLTWGRTADRRRVGPVSTLPADRPIWVRHLRYNIEFPASLAYGVAVFGSYRGMLYGFRQSDGVELWRHRPGNQRMASKFANQVAVSSWREGSGEDARRVARVFYANLSGVVGAVDLFTGEPVWRRVSGKAPGTGGRTLVFRSFEASPLLVGETVYVASRYHKQDSEAGLWALERRTGLVRWFCRLGTSDRSKIGASPTYSRGRVFTASYDGSVFAVDAGDGRVLWRRFIGGELYSTPTVAGPYLYIGNKTDGGLYCLRVADGSTVWCSVLGSSVYSSPAVDGGKVFVGTANDFVALSATDGQVLWRFPTPARVFGSASVLGSAVYFSDLGHTYACDTRSGALLWDWGAGRYSPVTATSDLILVCGRQRLYAFRPAVAGGAGPSPPAATPRTVTVPQD
jgi:outer membrane protein assembly factor BamB